MKIKEEGRRWDLIMSLIRWEIDATVFFLSFILIETQKYFIFDIWDAKDTEPFNKK
jgi:hypothetical protein